MHSRKSTCHCNCGCHKEPEEKTYHSYDECEKKPRHHKEQECECHCHKQCNCSCCDHGSKYQCCGEQDLPSPRPVDAPGWKPGDKSFEDPFTNITDEDKIYPTFQNAFFNLLTTSGSKGPKLGPRRNEYFPYLVIRANPGDRGNRPVSVFWESPDIFVAPDMYADSAPAIPPTHGGLAKAGAPNTLWVHVWNLGLAPVINARVEFYWFDPSLGFDSSSAHLIGTTHVDLGNRYSGRAHTIVKCPKTWIPEYRNGGHECLVVRLYEPMLDALGPNKWNAGTNRHIAQRNISVINASSPAILQLPLRLGCSTPPGPTTLEIVQEPIQNVPWLYVLAGKRDIGLTDAKFSNDIVGIMYPTKVRSNEVRKNIPEMTQDMAKSILHKRLEFERGCDELEVYLHVKVDGLRSHECKIYRIRQIANNNVVGGYTVIARKTA